MKAEQNGGVNTQIVGRTKKLRKITLFCIVTFAILLFFVCNCYAETSVESDNLEFLGPEDDGRFTKAQDLSYTHQTHICHSVGSYRVLWSDHETH